MTPSNHDLRIVTFGGVNAFFCDATVAKLQTNRARALLLYLALRRGGLVHREEICAALWPDTTEHSARAQLRKNLWRIRCALEPAERVGKPCLICAEDHLGLDGDRVWADFWEFSDALQAFDIDRSGGDGDDRVARLIQAVDRQSGRFAAGIFDPWCLEIQRSLGQARLTAIECIVGHYQRRELWVQAIFWARQGLALDPLIEHLHRIIMGCHMSMGDRASALRQYLACEEALRSGLAIAPSDETHAAARMIAGPGAAPAPAGVGAGAKPGRQGQAGNSLTALRARLAHHSDRIKPAKPPDGKAGNKVTEYANTHG